MLDQLACRRCHVSNGRGNRLAANLDGSAVRKSPEELAQSIRQPVEGMPVFGLDEVRTTTLVNAILAGGQGRNTKMDVPVSVHFAAPGSRNEDVFSRKCGSCHRMLSRKLGSIGYGKSAPDLSGLFSEHYPKSHKNGAAWSADNLLTWLKNPREVRYGAMMRPVELDRNETGQLLLIFSLTPDPAR